MALQIELLRDWLPCLKGMVYLNYGRTGPLLLPGAEKMARMVEEAKEPFQFHRDGWFKEMEQTRKSLADLVGAPPSEIAFANSTSSGLSLIAGAVRWRKGDRVVYPADEYPSNRFVWDNVEGVAAEAIEPEEGVSFGEQLEAMNLDAVRLVAVSAVSFWDGRRHDLERIGKLCKMKGILFSVDAIQAVGAVPVDVKAWGCDFLACGGQKWLFGPVGTGFVYVREGVIPKLRTPQMGWGSIKALPDLLAQKFELADGAKRFEASYFDVPAFAGLGACVEAMGRIGWEKIYRRVRELAGKAEHELEKLGFSPAARGAQSGIVAFDHPQAEEVFKALERERIYVTQRGNRIRLSLHAPVADEDLARFFSVLSK